MPAVMVWRSTCHGFCECASQMKMCHGNMFQHRQFAIEHCEHYLLGVHVLGENMIFVETMQLFNRSAHMSM